MDEQSGSKEVSRNLRKVWNDEDGVSPVIGTILMVAITVVLAGALVVMLPRINATNQDIMVGMATEIQGQGWVVKVINVQQGSLAVTEASVQIVNETSGAATVNFPSKGTGIGTGDGSNFDFYDNNDDGFVNPGDSFHVRSNQNVTRGHSFKIFKASTMAGQTKLI